MTSLTPDTVLTNGVTVRDYIVRLRSERDSAEEHLDKWTGRAVGVTKGTLNRRAAHASGRVAGAVSTLYLLGLEGEL